MTFSTIKHLVKNYLPLPIKRLLFTAKLHHHLPQTKNLKDGDVAIAGKPIVLLSMPRSGSSWIGSIIGNSEQVRYLREPVTTPYMLGAKHRISVFSPDKKDREHYYQLVDKALSGIPLGSKKVVPFGEQWQSLSTAKRLLIKEVNPFALSYYLLKQCQILYLARHPYAIANSYTALDWRSDRLIEKKVTTHEYIKMLQVAPELQQSSYAFKHGFLLGWVEVKIQQQLLNHRMIVRYEDICAEPTAKLSTILGELGLKMTNKIKTNLINSLSGKKQEHGKFCLVRDEKTIGKVIVNQRDITKYNELMSGYGKAYQYANTNKADLKPLYHYDQHIIE